MADLRQKANGKKTLRQQTLFHVSENKQGRF
jgi:hypothetical protein